MNYTFFKSCIFLYIDVYDNYYKMGAIQFLSCKYVENFKKVWRGGGDNTSYLKTETHFIHNTPPFQNVIY